MSSQPPYWGELPPPAAVVQRQMSQRRNSYNANRKATLPPDAELRGLHESPYPAEAQPQSKANRASQQSATTQSTQSPFASPVDSSFGAGGLAPRPSSYQAAPYNREAEERRRRRASRQQAEERAEQERGIAYDAGVTTGTATYSNGHGPAPNRQSSHRASNSQDRSQFREPEDFYRDGGNRYKPQRGPLSVNTDLGRSNTIGRTSAQQQAADDAERGIRRGSVTARKEKPEIRTAIESTTVRRGSSRRASEMSQEGFTSDKSPLQALESTYTKLKEEKRAKVEEAERLTRERQASGAGVTREPQNTVHFDGSSEPASKSVPRRAVVEDEGYDISPKTSAQIRDQGQRKPSALSQPLEERPSGRKLTKEPPSQSSPRGPAPPPKVPQVIEPGVQRNASFRERAGAPPDIILGTTASVGRSGSNKLKKNPPGDPWRLTREDLEAQAEEISMARRAEREQAKRMAAGGPLGSSPVDPPAQQPLGSSRTHANTKRQREVSQPIDVEDENFGSMPAVKRSNSARKVEQLLGAEVAFNRPDPDIRRAISPAEQQLYADRLDRSEELGPDGQGDIFGTTQSAGRAKAGNRPVNISAVTGDYVSDREEAHSRGKDGHHHFSNLIRGGRGNYRPGAGLYLPDKRLDEWKTAGIASLTGALLDIDANAQASAQAQAEADKDKAWWEAGNKGKRRPSAVRPMEAFGGDMSSEGNNGTVFSDFSYDFQDALPRVVEDFPSYEERWGRPRTPLPRTPRTPQLQVPERGSSSRRGAVSAVASTIDFVVPKDVVAKRDEYVVPRARQYIGFDGTSKRKSTVRKRNRSLMQPGQYSRKKSKSKPKKRKSARRQKGPSPAAAPPKRRASFFMKNCAHPEKHTMFHPFHTCKPSIHSLKSKHQSTRKDKLTTTARTHLRASRAGDIIVNTTFNPRLYLKCGPLLRYTGIRREVVQTRPGQPKRRDREIWRGSVMIVTTDKASDYRTPPTLKLFKQDRSLLPPPPETINSGAVLAHEYIDPIAGQQKCGRNGETLYVRPVEFLPEEKDLSRDETDNGLFSRSPHPTSPSATNPTRQPTVDGEKTGKTVSVKGFRLHTERGSTFWRFNIEVELTTAQQRIAYRINSGPSTGFWVPAVGTGMNIMNYSCNGFSLSVDSDAFSGPDPLWRDVLNTHQTRPFHVMIGGGDQIYNDCVMRETSVFAEWLGIKNPLHKHNAPFTAEMQEELEGFYMERYSMWFSQGLFGMANSQIPMVNLWDDHDIIDGFGSYPHHFMDSPVFTGLGAIAFKYYMLFQHQSVVDEGPANEPSWLLGTAPGPYVKERSRSLFMSLGGGLSFLGLDCRTERTRDEILSEQTYDAILDRCYAELIKGTTTHLIVLLGVPIAYPRLVWLENILTSRIMDPIKALSRAGAFGNLLNNFDGGVEILDDLDDHWTAKNHKSERRFLIQDLQDLAASKSVRITILSGDVHLAAIGQFYTSNKAGSAAVPKDKDHRYMPNLISSAIVNTPPPDMLADVLARRDKVHHLDGETDEKMIPLFGRDVDGKRRNNRVMLPRRNWASIRVWDGSASRPGTGEGSRTPSPEKGGGLGGLVRRLSLTRNDSFGTGPNRRQGSFGPRPPISGNGGGLLRRLSTSRGRPAAPTTRDSFDGPSERPTAPRRSLSLGGGIGGLIRRLSQSRARPPKRRDRAAINGYDSDTEEEERPYRDAPDIVRTRQGTFLRGGGQMTASEEEFEFHNGAGLGLGLRGGGAMTRSEEAVEEGYFAPKKGHRRGEDPMDDDLDAATPPPIRTGARGTAQGAAPLPVPVARSNTYADSRQNSTAPVSREGLQRSQTTNSARLGFHRTPTGVSAKGGLFGKKVLPEPVNLEGGLEITLNVEVNRKDPAGITAPYRLLVPRLWYDEPVGQLPGLDGAMETLPAPPLQRGNSFTGGLGGLMRRMSTKKATPVQTPLERDAADISRVQDIRVGDRTGDAGLTRKPGVTARIKGAMGFGLQRRRSSDSGSYSQSEDEHADTRLVPRANYGKGAAGTRTAPQRLNRGPPPETDHPDLPPAPMAPTRADEQGYMDDGPPQQQQPRKVYRDPKTEADLERRGEVDRPQGGVQRKNTLGDRLKGAMGLGLSRRDSGGSYTGSEFEAESPPPPAPPPKEKVKPKVNRGPYPSLQAEKTQRRESMERPPQQGVQRRNTLGDRLKGVVGLGARRDSGESYSGSEVETDDISPHDKRRATLRKDVPPRSGDERYPSLPQKGQGQRQQGREEMERERPQQGARKGSLGEGLKKAMGLGGGRRGSWSDRSYSGSEDGTELGVSTRNNPSSQRRAEPPRTGDKRYPSLPQKSPRQPPQTRQSMDRDRPAAGTQRRSSLSDGFKAAIGLGAGRKEYDSATESESGDEEIARRQAAERANATGDRRYPSLPQGRPPAAGGRGILDRRESGRRVDSGPLPVKRGAAGGGGGGGLGGGFKKMIGLVRKESFESERSWSEGEEDLQRMPRGDERDVVSEEENERGFKKVSGTKVERGLPVGGAGGNGNGKGRLLREGESGFTRQERNRRRMEEGE